MTPEEIISILCRGNAPLEALLLHHSRQVRDHALKVAEAHPELPIDRQLLAEGAMLHDIGVVLCDAPGIHCHGSHPYIEHGQLGAQILLADFSQNWDHCEPYFALKLAHICNHHTGTGLPGREPDTLEEEIICYADKFYSKSHPERVRTPEQTAQSLSKFGEEGVKKFWEWHQRFC